MNKPQQNPQNKSNSPPREQEQPHPELQPQNHCSELNLLPPEVQEHHPQQPPHSKSEVAEENGVQEEKNVIQQGDSEEKESEKKQNVVEGEQGNEEVSQQNQKGRKNLRKPSHDSMQESRQNETNQLQMVGGKKCFNKKCTSKKIFKKIRSKVQAGKYRFLCKSCYENYISGYFCQFCEQIYSNQEQDDEDMNNWVGCDTCERWNHIQCERKNRHKGFDINKDSKYECLACSRKSRNGGNIEQIPKKKLEDGINSRNRGAKYEISKDERVSIFHKKPETFPNLEPFLQTFSKSSNKIDFRLWLNEPLIRDDLDHLRSLIRRPPLDEEPKKSKKLKQD